MLAGKKQPVILIVRTQNNKIKQPAYPFDRDLGKKAASHLRRGHEQMNLFAAFPAFFALSH
jgi:hypothetical protein